MALHERAEAPRVVRGQHQLVEVEAADLREAVPAKCVPLGQFVVERHRRAAGGQGDGQVRPLSRGGGNVVGRSGGHRRRARKDPRPQA
jgi:hypothetical protein